MMVIVDVESCSSCPYYDVYGEFCCVNGKDLDKSAHLIQDWCPFKEEKE